VPAHRPREIVQTASAPNSKTQQAAMKGWAVIADNHRPESLGSRTSVSGRTRSLASGPKADAREVVWGRLWTFVAPIEGLG